MSGCDGLVHMMLSIALGWRNPVAACPNEESGSHIVNDRCQPVDKPLKKHVQSLSECLHAAAAKSGYMVARNRAS